MLFYCGGTLQDGTPCAFPGVGSGDQGASEPVFPRKCPKCGAEPIAWLRVKPVVVNKPMLLRAGAGWRCGTCNEWVTGSFHFCVPVQNPAIAGALVRPWADYEPLTGTILAVSKKYGEESRPELVEQRLNTLANLHRWAPWLALRAEEWLRGAGGREEAYSLFVDIEDTIRHYFTYGCSLIPVVEHAAFGERTSNLQDRLEEGWNLLKAVWGLMAATRDEKSQKLLVCDVYTGLNHEKGYQHVRLDLQEWLLKLSSMPVAQAATMRK